MISFGMFERSCCFKQCGYRNLMLQLWSADRQQQTQNITQTMGEDNFLKRSSKTQMFVFTASVLPSRVNRWNHQHSDLHDPLAGGRAVLRLPVHRDCLLQRRRVLKLPETGIHQIMIRQCGGSFRRFSDGGGDDKIARVLPVHVHPGPRLLCDCPGL